MGVRHIEISVNNSKLQINTNDYNDKRAKTKMQNDKAKFKDEEFLSLNFDIAQAEIRYLWFPGLQILNNQKEV